MEFFEKADIVFSLDEGNRPTPYKDTKGFWTIGKGHLIGDRLEDFKLTQNIINQLFREDLARAIAGARLIFGIQFFDALDDVRKIAILTLLYTLGYRKLLKFKETVPAIISKDWKKVHDLLLSTKWAKDVDPGQRPNVGRDDRVAQMFLTGEFPDYYGIKSNDKAGNLFR